MAQRSVAERVADAVKEPIESLGLELWDVRYIKEGASWYLRVYIDKEGGVDINDCTDVSRLIDPILDEYDIIGTSYYFEVCSPGLERELTRPEHFVRMLGREVRVFLFRPVEGKKEFVGKLADFRDGTVILENADGRFEFSPKDVSKVKLSDL